MNFVNSTRDEIGEIGYTGRMLLIGYKSLISTSALIGDTLILIGTLRYNAIRLHDILIIFIQNIAVADILLTVFSILPGVVSLAANRWILGPVLCRVSYFVNANCELVISLLISALAATKVLIVRFPLRAVHFSSRAACISVGIMWTYSFVFPTVVIARDSNGTNFNYTVYNCMYVCNSTKCKAEGSALFDVAVGLSVFTSTAVTVVSSVILIVLAKRVADRRYGGLQWRGVLVVLLTAFFHLLIGIPFFIYFIVSFYYDQQHKVHPVYVRRMFRYAWSISLVGAALNFYILTITLGSFRDFLQSRSRTLITLLTRCCTASGDEELAKEGDDGLLEEEDDGLVEEGENGVEEEEHRNALN